MRSLLSVVTFLLAATVIAAPVPKAVKKTDDANRLIGTWKPAAGELVWHRFDADGTLTLWRAENPDATYGYSWKLDSTATPKRLVMKGVRNSDRTYECVYELSGDGLKYTTGQTGVFPDTVAPGRGHVYYEMTRDTAAK